MTDIAAEVLAFGKRFAGRLEEFHLHGAMEYVEFNEVPLAIHILVTHIGDHAVKVSDDELKTIIELCRIPGTNISSDLIDIIALQSGLYRSIHRPR